LSFRFVYEVVKVLPCASETARLSLVVKSPKLRNVFIEAGELLQTMTDLYIIPLKPATAFRITPFETSIENLEEGFDFGFEQED